MYITIDREKLISLLLRITDESVPLFSSNRLHNLHKDVGDYLKFELQDLQNQKTVIRNILVQQIVDNKNIPKDQKKALTDIILTQARLLDNIIATFELINLRNIQNP